MKVFQKRVVRTKFNIYVCIIYREKQLFVRSYEYSALILFLYRPYTLLLSMYRIPNASAIYTSAYGVYIFQLMRYSRACGSYQDFFDKGLLLTRRLLNQGFLLFKLKSSLRKFYGRHHDLVDRYGISVSQMTSDMFHLL